MNRWLYFVGFWKQQRRLSEEPFVVRGQDLKVWFCLLPDFDESLSSLSSFFSCLPVLLEKEPGWSLIFTLTDCFAYRRSSSLIFPSTDGAGENTWGWWTNRRGRHTACRAICEDTNHRSFCCYRESVPPQSPKNWHFEVRRVFKCIFL